ncbi:MAG: SIR2 family protein [Terracidiphilus sp.]|nr:SIR2 family protein [Terracidiphilus sp.]
MAKQQRKIVFFLGAGASYGAGAYATVQRGSRVPIPMQSAFWDVFLRFCQDNKNRAYIESFLFRYFLGYDRVPARATEIKRRKLLRSIDVEEVFTFLSERSRAPSTSDALRREANKIWDSLVSELPNVFNRFDANADTRAIFRKLAKNFLRTRDTVVSFNYDTVFERSLPKTLTWHYESVQDRKSSIGVLKPHGSINWQDSKPILVQDTPERALVVAPTHLKFVQTGNGGAEHLLGYLDHSTGIEHVWESMEKEMREAKVLVFIGYSFPPADLYFSSILRSVLAVRDGAPAVAIVNPDAVAIARRLKDRFALKRIVRHFDLRTFVEGSRKNLLDRLSHSETL